MKFHWLATYGDPDFSGGLNVEFFPDTEAGARAHDKAVEEAEEEHGSDIIESYTYGTETIDDIELAFARELALKVARA